MNKIRAKITDIRSVKNLNIVNFEFNKQKLSMVSLDLDKNIKIGIDVFLSSKATHIAIAKDFSGELSYSNQIKAKIHSIENGELLCSITALCGDTYLESVITKDSALRMNLKENDEILLLIKASELSILELV